MTAPRARWFSRRDFLTTAAACTMLGRSLSAATRDVGEPKIVVGAHPWVYAATRPDRDLTPLLPQIFADMRYAGMDGIELMHTALRPDDAVERIGALSRRHGLPIIGTSFGGPMWNRERHQAVLDDARLIIPRLAQLGGRTLGTSVGAIKGSETIRKTADQLDAQAALLRELIALCAEHDVVLNLHNHTYELDDDLHDLRGTLERLPDVKLGPDVGWLVRGGGDPAAFIRKYGERIVFLHLRDQDRDGRWSEALGEGDVDFAAIAAALRQVRFRGDLIIELAHERGFTPSRSLRESLEISREFVRRTFGC